jgi:hypothetical protein
MYCRIFVCRRMVSMLPISRNVEHST